MVNRIRTKDVRATLHEVCIIYGTIVISINLLILISKLHTVILYIIIYII